MRLVLASAILVLAFSAQASEPNPGTLNLTMGGGLNVPSEDEAKNGYVIGGGLGVHLTPRLVLGAEISYLGYGAVEDVATGIKADQSYVDYFGLGKYYFTRNRTTPYAKGFVGRYDVSLDISGGGESMSLTNSDLVYGGGLGLLVRGEKDSNLYLEALVRQVELEDTSTNLFTFTIGMDFGFRF